MQVITTENRPIKMWLDDMEDGALAQAKNLANLPFIYKHVAIMPDSHQGYGMPIGGVMATEGVVIPNAVGVDIGCGMCAVKTSLTEIDTDELKRILGEIRKQIPVGFNKHKERQDDSLVPSYREDAGHMIPCVPVVHSNFDNALKSVGTLGGGNHFIEIQKGDDGHIWIMIHSGSRNLGLQVAKHYNNLAIELNKKWHSVVPKEWELAYLPLDSSEGCAYIREMEYCVDYALANRRLMMARVCDIIQKEITTQGQMEKFVYCVDFEKEVNIAHNYAAMENHFGKNVMVHRKGATLARKGTIGIIPGSQGTTSYIVEGLGNKDSFDSCSHGAGRRMGRKQAQRELNLVDEQKFLDDQGILHGIRGEKDLDEASGAYKDIDTVMDNQKDLVKILTKLTPLAVIKG